MLSRNEIDKTVRAFAECGMRKSKTAKVLFISKTGLEYRLRLIKRQTGFDPTNYYELLKLLENGGRR